jgi:hypothetical protein
MYFKMDRIPYKLNEVLYPDHNKVMHSNEYSNAPYQVYNLDPNSQNNGFYLCLFLIFFFLLIFFC